MIRLPAILPLLLLVGCIRVNQALPRDPHLQASKQEVVQPVPAPTIEQFTKGSTPIPNSSPEHQAPETIRTQRGKTMHSLTSEPGTPQSVRSATPLPGDVTEADIGVPFYPGSSVLEGGMKVSGVSGTTSTSIRMTDAPPPKVIDFYEAKLGKPMLTNRQVKEPLAVWKVGKAMITVSTSILASGTQINISNSPDNS